MIVRKTKYTRGRRPSNRSSFRRNSHQRNGVFGSNNSHRTKIKGNPNEILNKYLIMAKNALSSGDFIQAEYYFQHADHYSRVMTENNMEVKIINKEVEQKKEEISVNEVNEKKKIETVEREQEEKLSNADQDDDDDKPLDSVAFLSNNISKK